MRWAMTARPRRWFVQIPDKRMRTREFGVKSICWTSPDLGEGGELWGFLGVGQGEKLGVNLAPISPVISGWIWDVCPPWFQSIPESWNRTHRVVLCLEGRFVFMESTLLLSRSMEFGWNAICLSRLTRVWVLWWHFWSFQALQEHSFVLRNWSAAVATGNTESGLAGQWLKMHVWKSYFFVNNCFICWRINASIQIAFFVLLRLGFMCS